MLIQRLVDTGNTVLVNEYDLDAIKCADRLIDAGPGGGDKGGTVVVAGTPEDVAACEASYTGRYLRKIMAGRG
jgi:excinuclease ABC subunit A